jgi:hypothetical protein
VDFFSDGNTETRKAEKQYLMINSWAFTAMRALYQYLISLPDFSGDDFGFFGGVFGEGVVGVGESIME